MNTDKTLEVRSEDLEATYRLARSLGQKLRGGEVFVLVGDLGAGKTAFVRGVMSAFDAADDVSSPSFTVSNSYQTDKFVINHYDFHRLDQAGVVGSELQEAIADGNAVTFIEWGGIVRDALPANTVEISISPESESEARNLVFKYNDEQSYLFEGGLQ